MLQYSNHLTMLKDELHMLDIDQKPTRPLGVTLAIIVSVIMYSLLPLATVILILTVESIVSGGTSEFDSTVNASASGGEFLGGFTGVQLVIQIVLSIVFFVMAIFAWRGKPPYMRYVLMLSVILLALINIGFIVVPQLTASDQGLVGRSGGSQQILASLQVGQIVLLVLVPLYVVWYLNRGPARAFYRGHYLQRPPGDE